MDSLPSSGIVALQAKIREYVNLMAVRKRQRDETKILNQKLKALGDDILESMREHQIPSCVSQGYNFAVKDKTKMKSATAKTFLVQVKDYFKIPDETMALFVDQVNAKRKSEAEIVTTLECKAVKKSTHGSETDATPPPAGVSLSTAIDDMYD